MVSRTAVHSDIPLAELRGAAMVAWMVQIQVDDLVCLTVAWWEPTKVVYLVSLRGNKQAVM